MKDKPQKTPRQLLWETLERNRREVETWPAWMRRALRIAVWPDPREGE